MLSLALDTSTRRGSVALGRTGDSLDLLGEVALEVSATHSETVLPAIDRLVRSAGCSPVDLEAVVVGAGPGSFTGVRIGAALARGICFPARATLFAYSSLASIAAVAGPGGPVCALLDARRDQVYAAGYVVGPPGFEERFAPRAGALGDLLDELDPAAWRFAGVLSAEQRAAIERAGGTLDAEEVGRPSGAGLLRLVQWAPDAGRVADPARWEPTYVRSSSARRRMGGS
ncbi:MAG TPA: tRNA (adenosine(37)-N6)-threonylcarbamoyltransferase complex dimerization subunit type 1 TsaB [Gemmatimonadota bacterium]|nr:tRNA (adenosine(37)-N6)-threonylcarbamoyltransferase complex dimerization subunit type 1 TsaB [Gemmatimonadota bacterium]